MKKCLLSLLILGAVLVNAQVLIDDTGAANAVPHEAATLEVKSNDKGFLLPRLDAPTAAMEVEGMVYFDTTNKVFKGYNGGAWVLLSEEPMTYSISIVNAANVIEGQKQEFTVTITPAVEAGHSVSVDYITIDDTAIEGSDFEATTGTLTFAEGDLTKTIEVVTTNDTEIEENETYNLIIDAPQVTGNAIVTVGNDTATGTILDNDAPLPLGFYQDFDANSTWNYTASPAPYNINSDVWDIVNTLESISSLTDNFWGMRDLNNNNGGGSQLHTLTFEEIDITDKTNVVFKFDYESIGLNTSNDKYGYELFYDDVSQGKKDICEGCNKKKIGTISINIPDDINKISVIIYGQFDGGYDIAAIDNIALTF